MQIQNLTLDPAEKDGWVERSAKLFEAGDYPDKGLAVTAEQLIALAQNFKAPVPVLIEHADSPLEMGYLTGVQALGLELFGTVSLTPEANSLVERSGARALSLGLSSDLASILEVSLVRNPRVESAQLFSSGPTFCGELGESCALEGEALDAAAREVFGEAPDHGLKTHDTHGLETRATWRERYERLVSQTQEDEAERQVRQFVAEGRLCPAQAPLAKSLLLSSDAVRFDGESQPVGQLFRSLIERQAPLALFSEQAPQPAEPSSPLLLPEEADFYRRYFPDVSLKEISRGKARA